MHLTSNKLKWYWWTNTKTKKKKIKNEKHLLNGKWKISCITYKHTPTQQTNQFIWVKHCWLLLLFCINFLQLSLIAANRSRMHLKSIFNFLGATAKTIPSLEQRFMLWTCSLEITSAQTYLQQLFSLQSYLGDCFYLFFGCLHSCLCLCLRCTAMHR